MRWDKYSSYIKIDNIKFKHGILDEIEKIYKLY